MSLPLAPEPNVEYISGHREPFVSYDADQMREYGQACRAAALEEAALAAFEAPVKTYRQDTRDACANAIRRLI